MVLKLLLILLLLNFHIEIKSQNAGRSCIRCICHAVSACYDLRKCAEYSINFEYWRAAGAPVVPPDDRTNINLSYQNCMNDDTCITNTIFNYTTRLGHIDCNCDHEFTCDDMLAFHFNLCNNVRMISSQYLRRYRNCSGYSMEMPINHCMPQKLN